MGAEPKRLDVAIIGGGQAGLSMSYCLTEKGVTNHLIFEKNFVGYAWQEERWDSFCLVTPNFQCRLPGFDYDGNDPKGFMLRDEIVAFLKRYVERFSPPLLEGVEVFSVFTKSDYFVLKTSQGVWEAKQVVVAIGAYHKARIPKGAEHIPSSIFQIHSQQYRNPNQLPKEGSVIVVGSAQSGVQIVDDLKDQRKVHLCLGGAPRSPRKYRGRDVVEWFEEMGHYDLPIDQFEDQESVKHETNHYLSGRDGGKDIDLRQFSLDGIKLYGFLDAIDGKGFTLRPDLKDRLDSADATYVRLRNRIDNYIKSQELDIPEEPPYEPVWEPIIERRKLFFEEENVTAIVWAIGFEADFNFIHAPVFAYKGYPKHERGVTAQKGLYFLGLPWLYTWGSGRFAGISRDAEYLAQCIFKAKS